MVYELNFGNGTGLPVKQKGLISVDDTRVCLGFLFKNNRPLNEEQKAKGQQIIKEWLESVKEFPVVSGFSKIVKGIDYIYWNSCYLRIDIHSIYNHPNIIDFVNDLLKKINDLSPVRRIYVRRC